MNEDRILLAWRDFNVDDELNLISKHRSKTSSIILFELNLLYVDDELNLIMSVDLM